MALFVVLMVGLFLRAVGPIATRVLLFAETPRQTADSDVGGRLRA